MQPKQFLQHIRALIAQDEFSSALQQLRHFLEASPKLDIIVSQVNQY